MEGDKHANIGLIGKFTVKKELKFYLGAVFFNFSLFLFF